MRALTELYARMAELERRLASSVRHGTVEEVDAKAGRVRLRMGGSDEEPFIGPWVPYTQQAGGLKVHAPPTKGQQMTAINPTGDFRQAVAVPMTWSDQNKSPSDKGDENVLTYGNVVVGLKNNNLALTVGGVSIVQTGDGVTITGDVFIKGNVRVEGGISAIGGEFTHDDVDVGRAHRHRDVMPGTANTGIPIK